MKKYLLTVVAPVALFFTLGAYLSPTDSTDGSWSKRSGISLHIDHETGCHYLGTLFGALTPRLDRDGEHICRPEVSR